MPLTVTDVSPATLFAATQMHTDAPLAGEQVEFRVYVLCVPVTLLGVTLSSVMTYKLWPVPVEVIVSGEAVPFALAT